MFGVEINDTSLRFYVDETNNTIREMTLPQLCMTDPDFVWGQTPYMPFQPLYGIINVAVNELSRDTNLSWWQTNNATTEVDWVRWYEFVPTTVESAVDTV